MCSYNPCPWEVETTGTGIKRHPWLQSQFEKFESILDCMKLRLKNLGRFFFKKLNLLKSLNVLNTDLCTLQWLIFNSHPNPTNSYNTLLELGGVSRACNPITWEVEAGEIEAEGRPCQVLDQSELLETLPASKVRQNHCCFHSAGEKS